MSRAGHQTGGDLHTRTERGDDPLVWGTTLGPFATNCYVVSFPGSNDCWIIDASFEPDELIEKVQQDGLKPVGLILTHAHCDHIAGVYDVLRAFPGLPVALHEAETAWMNNPLLNLSMMTGIPVTGPAPDKVLRGGEELTLAGQPWRVLHTPGHSPGGISLWHEPSNTLFDGDALLAGSIGRTDFPGSDHEQLMRSIREKLYTLPDDTRVYSGHGPSTTIGREKRSNPFARP